MDVTVAFDGRYSVAPDGSVWSQLGAAWSFWKRYLDVFDRVIVVARAVQITEPPGSGERVNGENVRCHCIPNFHGPWELLSDYFRIQMAVRTAVPSNGAVILRVGSQIANMMEPALRQRQHPYALEVVGDPSEVFAPGVVDHPLRPFFRWHFSRKLRMQCKRAIGVAYVTRQALQARYPTGGPGVGLSDVDLAETAIMGRVYATSYSSIELGQRSFVGDPNGRTYKGGVQLVTVGSLAQRYKGVDVLIEAVARCVRMGGDLRVGVVGDGMYRQELMAQAERAGVGTRFRFVGQVTAGAAVREILDASDLFVLASRTEGLPRAMIEAMARGLPCIGTAVGGIPELLESDEMVPAGDAGALAAKIMEVVRDPRRMESMGRRNLEKAREYSESILAERRRGFYEYVRDRTREWEAGRVKI